MSTSRCQPPSVGYLHIGDPTHGVARYGQILAQAARTHTDSPVQEESVVLSSEVAEQARQLRAGAQSLSSSDVVHLQYNQRIWGEPLRAPFNLETFIQSCAPPLVVTLHDVRDGYKISDVLRRLWCQWSGSNGTLEYDGPQERAEAKGTTSNRSLFQLVYKGFWFLLREGGDLWTTRRLATQASQVLVCTEEEARRVENTVGREQLRVIPHFVEGRSRNVDRKEAKRRLNLGESVLGVLGFMHRTKGHDLVVDALSYLPDVVEVVFIGRAGRNSEDFRASLLTRADALGVRDRLHMTGYVREDELDYYLQATDLAICPFREASASGSLSTWIAAGRPILASDLPLFREYNDRVEGSIATFSPYTPEKLAEEALERLQYSGAESKSRVCLLRQSLSLDKIISQHYKLYRQAAELDKS